MEKEQVGGVDTAELRKRIFMASPGWVPPGGAAAALAVVFGGEAQGCRYGTLPAGLAACLPPCWLAFTPGQCKAAAQARPAHAVS